MLDMDIANALPSIASQLDRLGLARSQHLEALHAYSQNRDACLNRIIERHGILPLDHESPRDIAKRLANSILGQKVHHGPRQHHIQGCNTS